MDGICRHEVGQDIGEGIWGQRCTSISYLTLVVLVVRETIYSEKKKKLVQIERPVEMH